MYLLFSNQLISYQVNWIIPILSAKLVSLYFSCSIFLGGQIKQSQKSWALGKYSINLLGFLGDKQIYALTVDQDQDYIFIGRKWQIQQPSSQMGERESWMEGYWQKNSNNKKTHNPHTDGTWETWASLWHT